MLNTTGFFLRVLRVLRGADYSPYNEETSTTID